MLEEGDQVGIGEVVVDDEAGVDRYLRPGGPVGPYDGCVAVPADMVATVEHEQVRVIAQCPGGGEPADAGTDDDG